MGVLSFNAALVMTERSDKIDQLLLSAIAAGMNCRQELREHGESAALRGFADMLGIATTGLRHTLEEVRLTSEDEANAAKVFALKQEIEAASKKTVAKSKELAELLAKAAKAK
jgi:hypothetical protein